jgi:predicted NUDIX family phosphoesterase
LENILVVKSERLRPFLREKGLVTECLAEVADIIVNEHCFMPRPDAETNPEYKQIIPYVTIRRVGEVFVTKRLSKGGEARLHGLLSIGAGGHIAEGADTGGGNVLMNGLHRELSEEVYIERELSLVFAGLINDDTNEVGSVHLGLFCVLDVSGEVKVLETEKLEGFWADKFALLERAYEMESWSALVLPCICG